MDTHGMGRKRKRGGGVRQRIATARHTDHADGANSSLAYFLLSMFAWGDFSPQCVQKIAALACADMQAAREGRSFPDLEQLASLGTSGAHPNKCYADLMNKLHGNATTPEPCVATLSFKEPIGKKPQSMFLPHEMFANIHTKHPATWRKSILPSLTAWPSFGTRSKAQLSLSNTHSAGRAITALTWYLCQCTAMMFPSPALAKGGCKS